MSEELRACGPEPQLRAIRFAAFELDVRAGELRKHGIKIRLQEQPFQVLLMLLERSGEVVLREEIRKKLWPNDTIVEFAPSINAAIQRLRDALGDSADEPRYVETVARRGYRFIADLLPEVAAPDAAQPQVEEDRPDANDLSGRTLSHYRVYEKLGRGGMGEVYRARDTKLNRDVALKVLPEEFANNADRMARFEREAQVLASLNHPNIAAIHGVEEASGIRALVMELVEGPTLAERIGRGAVPLEEALRITQQMADALEAAHEKGVVHRDLKPANVKVTLQGVVKVLDFGLATVMQDSHDVFDSPENSPTRTATFSQAGVILGTAAYMSPEQARGEAVDKRADIWAFGVVLHEMLTGKRLFEGQTTTEILSSVLTKEPEWDEAPAKVQRLLRRCLEKDPKRRLRDIGEASFLLEDLPPTRDPRHRKLIAALAIAPLSALLALALLYFRQAPPEPRLKLSVLPPENTSFGYSIPALSPDAKRVAFVANDSLWLRDLDSLTARSLPGTEGAFSPFWSPDGRWIAFFTSDKLKKIDTTGGPPVALCDKDTDSAAAGSWSKRDVIIFSMPYRGVFRVAAAGGRPTAVTASDPEGNLGMIPWFLPDGHHFLYSVGDKGGVYVGDLDSNARSRISAEYSNAVYSPPGYLLFARKQSLMAQRFDAERLQLVGEPVQVADQVQKFIGSAWALFSASPNVLAYLSGLGFAKSQLTWFDRSGKALGKVGNTEIIDSARISPDGSSLAVDQQDAETELFCVWLYDLKRGTASRFTFLSNHTDAPNWSPDGTRIVFGVDNSGARPMDLFQKAISGASKEEPLVQSGQRLSPRDWSSDGRYIIFNVVDPKTKQDIWVLPLSGDRKPFPYLNTEFEEVDAKLSPDGRWLAYQSDESRRDEIYVQSFPTPGGKWKVSINGGEIPRWSRDGKELFFMAADHKMMAAAVKQANGKFETSVPKPLFDMPDVDFFDVSKDGRFLIPVPTQQSGSGRLNVVINWTGGLRN